MSKKCPNCSEELKDDALVCEKCGQELAPEEESVTEPAAEPETAPEEEAVTELAEEETDDAPDEETEEAAPEAEDAEAVTEAVDEEETAVASDDVDPEDQPASEEKPAKKPLSFGAGLGIGIGIAALIAAIVCGVMMIIASSGPAADVEKYINSFKEGKYEDYFSKDYTVMFKSNDLDSRVEMAEQYGNLSQTENLQAKVIQDVKLSDGTKNTIKSQLEAGEYADIDKIEDIRLVLLELSNTQASAADTGTDATEATEATEATDEAAREYWVSSFYAIKVDGKWYFTTSF